jgi:hypothetical protein
MRLSRKPENGTEAFINETGAFLKTPEDEARRVGVRLPHELLGSADTVRFATLANHVLEAEGQGPIDAETLTLTACVCSVHDAPSRRVQLPYRPDTPAAELLELFVQGDCATMLDFDPRLKSVGKIDESVVNEIPIGPLAQLWADQKKQITHDAVAKQILGSAKSHRERLKAAFGVPSVKSVQAAFPNAAICATVKKNAEAWQQLLGIDLGFDDVPLQRP